LEHRLTQQELDFGKTSAKFKAQVQKLKAEKQILIKEIKRLGASPSYNNSAPLSPTSTTSTSET